MQRLTTAETNPTATLTGTLLPSLGDDGEEARLDYCS